MPHPFRLALSLILLASVAVPSANAQATAPSTSVGQSGPQARSYAEMVVDTTNNRVLLSGGCCDASGQNFDDVWSFSLASNAWSQLSAGGTPRLAAGVA